MVYNKAISLCKIDYANWNNFHINIRYILGHIRKYSYSKFYRKLLRRWRIVIFSLFSSNTHFSQWYNILFILCIHHKATIKTENGIFVNRLIVTRWNQGVYSHRIYQMYCRHIFIDFIEAIYLLSHTEFEQKNWYDLKNMRKNPTYTHTHTEIHLILHCIESTHLWLRICFHISVWTYLLYGVQQQQNAWI